MNETTLFGVTIVPAIVGLVQVCKDAGLPPRFAPAVAVGFGIVAGVAQVLTARFPLMGGVALGVSFGLSAAGLYDTARTVFPTFAAGPPSPPVPPGGAR